MRDQHFSVVAHFLKKIQNIKRLTNASEICEALNNYQSIENNRKKKDDVINCDYLAIIMPSEDREIRNNKLKIPQIESLYNFQNVDGIINTTIFSDLNELIALQGTKSEDEKGQKIKKLPIKRLENSTVNINHLKTKRINIEQEFRIANNETTIRNLITPEESAIPNECFKRITSGHHSKNCQELCNFTTEEISNLTGTRLIPELVLHKHSQKVLKRTKNQKSVFMTIAERKQELILHYNVHHNIY